MPTDWFAEATQPAATPQPKGTDWYASAVSDVPSGQPGWQTEQAPIYSPETSAGIGDTAVASLGSDPTQRMEYYSQQRGVPLDRYKVIQGRVAYLDRKGDWRYEESPNFLPGSMKEAGQQIASGVGGAIPAVAGGAVGIASSPLMLTGPAGLGVSLAATGAAGAGAEAVRQGLADKFVAPREIDKGKILMEGAQAMVGQGLGAGLGALEQRYAVPDIGRLNTPAADALDAKAASMDPPLTLTPAQSTNLASLKNQETALRNRAGTSDAMQDFYASEGGKQGKNIERFLNTVSPEASTTVAGGRGVSAAKGSIEGAIKERTKAVSPAYSAVVRPENVVDPVALKGLLDDEFFAKQIAAVKGDPLNGMQALPDTSLVVLDKVKKNLDFAVKAAKKDGDRDRVRLLERRLKQMVGGNGIVDKAFPDYPIARGMFESRSPEIDALTESVLAKVAKLKGPQVKNAAGIIFSPEGSSVEQITRARNILEKNDPQTWQDLKRAWMQMQWAKAQKTTLSGDATNAGAKWRQRLLGGPDKQAMMKAALNKDEYAALQDLGDVLEATARVKNVGSDTAYKTIMEQKARKDAEPWLTRIVGVVCGLPTLLNGRTPFENGVSRRISLNTAMRWWLSSPTRTAEIY
jgi:hypothetical protein